jgi:hypothetical protein
MAETLATEKDDKGRRNPKLPSEKQNRRKKTTKIQNKNFQPSSPPSTRPQENVVPGGI